MGRHLICNESEIAQGKMKKFTINGLDILVVNAGDTYYAVDDTCTHAGASLSEGTLKDDNCTITCGWHKAEFDCKTGNLAKFPAPIRNLGSYKTSVESGNVFVET